MQKYKARECCKKSVNVRQGNNNNKRQKQQEQMDGEGESVRQEVVSKRM